MSIEVGEDILGIKVKDIITGVSGYVLGYTVYITGCNQVLVQPTSQKKDEYKDSFWFDDVRLDKVKGIKKIVLQEETPAKAKRVPKGFCKEAPKI